MVYIKKMIVRNFKSFAGEIKLNFQPGFNIITGPNGSGKSNILDAVQFVLGELGTKRMRVPDLAGLIYDGASEEPSSRIAQTTLYFENSDRKLAIDRNTISIGRKIDKEGKSIYLINNKRTSRRQVVELLEMAGITPGGYNIVLQGTATRLSDLTPQERMNALEDLIGIKEYDDKKATAKVRLNEAERKIEVANARIEEIKRQVNQLERQRNDALRFNLLNNEEKRLTAIKLSNQLNNLEEKQLNLDNQIKEREENIRKLEEERAQYTEEKINAQNRLDEFNRDASEKGNTKLPLIRSEVVGKKTFGDSLKTRLKDIETRKSLLTKIIEEKNIEIKTSGGDIDVRKQELIEIAEHEASIKIKLEQTQSEFSNLENKIREAREIVSSNQVHLEDLTESLVPMQESFSGIEIEINRHMLAAESLEQKISDLNERRVAFLERREVLDEKLKQYDNLKEEEAKKLQEMMDALENQLQHQKNIRGTIENANVLAKEAETTITEFSAKRDLWKNIVTEDKARARIVEIGDAGALDGYHGPLRPLIKIDLPNQRAVNSSAVGWINAIIVENYEVAKESIDRLKKTKIGMTRFIPLDKLRTPDDLPTIEGKGIVGYIPKLIRYDEIYAPVVHLIWGDTFIVEDPDAAEQIISNGFRAVTRSGDVFEPKGGIIGGYYHRSPDLSKLIPTDESIKNLSNTIKNLRSKLKARIKEFRTSGVDLRKFYQFMEDSQGNIKRIDIDKKSTEESIERLNRNLMTLEENIAKSKNNLENANRLKTILMERKAKTIEQIEETKEQIDFLKNLKPSDVSDLEIQRNNLNLELQKLYNKVSELENDQKIQNSFVERILIFKIQEAEQVKLQSATEIEALDIEYKETEMQIKEIEKDVQVLDNLLKEMTNEVEATTKVFEQHQKTIRQITERIDRLARRRNEIERRISSLIIEQERIKINSDQKLEELSRIGFHEKINVNNYILENIERQLQQVKSEKNSLGAINQLAIEYYHIQMREYKERSTRINNMEEEKQSILSFIGEIEQEKQDHFMAAYNQIGENFSAIFTKLTGGGGGQLELQKPEAPFSGGVDLYIQFPGKPMRLAGGASGGERSVAAISYLLAIQRFLKAPFYLFDEIDAHLDDLNTSRLAEVLKENSIDSQFLMVSLKDVMVHNADRIYGVFAQNGRSRVLSLPMKEARVAA
jgi:chromosome segregation protein